MLGSTANAPGSASLPSSGAIDTYEAEDDEGKEEEDGDEEEVDAETIAQLMGKLVDKTVPKEGGITDIVQGAVSSYFPAIQKFRVMYFDGECTDLTYQQVLESTTVQARASARGKKRKLEVEEGAIIRKRKKSNEQPTASMPTKRPKILEQNGIAATKETLRPKPSPTVKSPSPGATLLDREMDMQTVDNVEFKIMRKVIYVAVSTMEDEAKEAQLGVLSSAELKDTEALEAFVQKDGLVTLAELLDKWENQVEAEAGVLLILKILAVLPGITCDAIRVSKIGLKLRRIQKHGSFKNTSIPDFAGWIVEKMKADIGMLTQSTRVNGKFEQYEGKRARASTQNSFLHARDTARGESIPENKSNSASNGSRPSPFRSNSASHLLSLMNSRDESDASASSTRNGRRWSLLSPQNKRKSSNANMWRAKRSTVVLDRVLKRVSENTQDAEDVTEEEEWHPSKISFAEQEVVCAFEQEVEVSKLFAVHMYGTKAPERPQVPPRAGPLRSILRARLPPPTALREISPLTDIEHSELVAPAVLSTSRPALDRIATSAERPSLSGEVPEDNVFRDGKLSKAVSPTEKVKRNREHDLPSSSSVVSMECSLEEGEVPPPAGPDPQQQKRP